MQEEGEYKNDELEEASKDFTGDKAIGRQIDRRDLTQFPVAAPHIQHLPYASTTVSSNTRSVDSGDTAVSIEADSGVTESRTRQPELQQSGMISLKQIDRDPAHLDLELVKTKVKNLQDSATSTSSSSVKRKSEQTTGVTQDVRVKTSQPDLSELAVPSGISQQENPDVLEPRFHFRSGNTDRNAGNPVSRISLILLSAKPPSDVRSKIEKNEEPITKPNERPIVVDQITVEKEHLMSSLRHDPLLVLQEPTPMQSPTYGSDEVDVTEQTKTHLCKKEMESIDSPMEDNANQLPLTSDQRLLVLQKPASTQDPANAYDSMQVIGKITSNLVDKYVAVEQIVMQGDDSMSLPEEEQLIMLSKPPPQQTPCSGYDSMEVMGKISSKQFPTGKNTSDGQSDLPESRADAAAHLTGQEKGKKLEHLAQANTTSESKSSRPECVKIVENITQVSKEAECVSSFDPSTNLALPSRYPARVNMDSEFVNSNTVLQEPGKCISKLDKADSLQEQISTNENNFFSAPAFEVVMPDIPIERNPVQESGMPVTNQVWIDTKRGRFFKYFYLNSCLLLEC